MEAPDWTEEFNHRAAILQYDAGFSRRDAEEEAMYFIAMQQYEWRLKHDGIDGGCNDNR